MDWYFHLLKNFPQFVVIHTVKGIVKKAEEDVFLELSCFFDDPMDVGNLISGFAAFSKSNLNCGSGYMDAKSFQSCPTLCIWAVTLQALLSMTVLQVRIMEWVG